MITFVVIYRDRHGDNHRREVYTDTDCHAVQIVLREIPCAESAWVVAARAL